MGQSRGGGYRKVDTLTPDVQALIQQMASQAGGNTQAAAEGYKQFLPGGGGGQAFSDLANKNFQQQTVPSILNAFGSGAKGSSALNQAIASGASDMNTNLAALLASAQLQAAQGLGSLGSSQFGTAASTPQFAYLQRQTPFWQSAILGGLGSVGGIFGGR